MPAPTIYSNLGSNAARPLNLVRYEAVWFSCCVRTPAGNPSRRRPASFCPLSYPRCYCCCHHCNLCLPIPIRSTPWQRIKPTKSGIPLGAAPGASITTRVSSTEEKRAKVSFSCVLPLSFSQPPSRTVSFFGRRGFPFKRPPLLP